MPKIFSNDPLVHYKNSTVSPERTKVEIDMILGQWGIKDTHWHWDPDHNDVYVQIKIEEKMSDLDVPVAATIKVQCPTVWDKASPRARPPRGERVNWRVSMRALHWFLKTHLEMAYVMRSDKIRAFLSHVKINGEKDLGDLVIPRLAQIQELAALPDLKNTKGKGKVIDVTDREKEPVF